MAIIDVGAKVKFDSSIFTHPFPTGCDCTKCDSMCCEAGALISLEERDRIIAVKDELIPLLKPDRQDPAMWFSDPDPEDFTRLGEEPTPEKMAKYVGTGNGKNFCNFFNPKFGCALQKLSVDKGEHKWKIKPEGCILYPIYIDEQDVVRPDDTLDGTMWCQQKENFKSTVFRATQAEIAYVAGGQALERLKEVEKDYYTEPSQESHSANIGAESNSTPKIALKLVP